MGRTPRIPRELTIRPFSLDDARAAGISLSALRGKSWERIGSKLYRWRGAPEDKWELIRAWVRVLPAGAVFVGRTAAWMHRLDVEPTKPVEVAMPPDSEVRSRAGLDVRHCDVANERIQIRGLRATSLHRTLLDLCARSPAVDALVAIDMAIRARLTNQEMLWSHADRVKGQPGSARLRLLATFAAPAESPMETRLRWLLIQAGLPRPEVQVDLHDAAGRFVGRADLYYPPARLAIEYDGGNHRDRLVSDDRRQNLLVNAGVHVMRFTAADIYQRPAVVAAQVLGALAV